MTGPGGAPDALVEGLLAAVRRSIDPARLREELDQVLAAGSPSAGAAAADGPAPDPGAETAGPASTAREVGSPEAEPATEEEDTVSPTAKALLTRFALADILDDSILGARPSSPSFPLRVFFGELSEHADEDTAFALGSGLNFYFRVPMDEEAKVRVAIEVSRLYYRFVAESDMEPALVSRLSPLLAKLMSTELSRLRLESVDHVPVFDSGLHERGPTADTTSPSVKRPETFLTRVAGNNMVRFKAVVVT